MSRLQSTPTQPSTYSSYMAPKGGNAKKEAGRAKKAENEAKKREAADVEKVCGVLVHSLVYRR